MEMVILAIATPILAFAGGLFGTLVKRKGDAELDRWRKREETMRILRWATEMATDHHDRRAEAGLTVLSALLDSPLLDDADVDLVAGVATYLARTSPPAPDADHSQLGPENA